jgi:hypothetical protein
MAEQPALNRFYVASYAANDKDFPILAVRLDPRVAGYRVPEDLSPHPDSKRYPNHVFTGSQPSNGDERVTHVYEILPSPWVPFTRYDDDLGPIQGRRRSVKNEGQQADLAADKKISYEGREGSAIVSNEIEETWSIATDEDGNSLFPIKDRDFYDPSRGAVQERRQLFVPTGEEEGTLENVNGVITQTSYEPYNEFLSVKIVQTYKVDGPQLIGRATDNDGQLVTVTTQRKGSDGYIPPNPTATRTVEVSREDAESLVERIVDTPEIFNAQTFSVERPDPIPQKFRVAVPIRSSQEVVEGQAELPELSEGEISRNEEQRNKFLKRVSATSRDQAVLPQTLIQKSTDNDRQEVTITETLQLGDTNEVATATTTISSEALGDGNFVVTKTEVPEVFAGKVFQKTKDDLTPQKFRGAQESNTVEESVAGIAQSPSLGSGEFVKSEQQVNKFVKRVSTTSRAITQAVTLLESILTPEGQIGSRTLTLASGVQTFTPSATLIDANVEALGDGRTVKTETKVPNVFAGKTVRKTKIDLTPEKFKAKQEDTTTEETVAGTIAQSINLGAGEFAKSEQQVTEFVKRTSTTSRSVEATSSLSEFVITPQGQLATRNITLAQGTQTLQPSATLLDGSVEALGDGRSVKTEIRVPAVFDEKQDSKQKPDIVPQEFRASLPDVTISEVKVGTSTTFGSLATDEVSKTIQRVTADKIRETTTVRAQGPYQALTDSIVDNDGLVITRIKTVAKSPQTIIPSATISGTVQSLGDGFTLKTQDTKQVFRGNIFSQEKPDNIPVEFRAQKPAITEEFSEAGTVAQVSLQPTEIAKSEQQVTEFIKRTRKTTRDLVGGVTLSDGQQIDEDGVKVTVTRSLQDGSQDITPTATVRGQVEDIGDGKTIKTELVRAEVFDGQVFSREKPDNIPVEFRVEKPASVDEKTVEGQVEQPNLEGTELSKSEQQITKFLKRIRTVTRDDVDSVTLEGSQINQDGQVVTVRRSLAKEAQFITPSATLSGNVQNLGGGYTVKTEEEIPKVFRGDVFSQEKPDNIPVEFRAEKPATTKEFSEDGTAAEVTLSDTEISKSEQQVTEFVKRTRTTTRDLVGGVTLGNGRQIDEDGIKVTVTRTLAEGSQEVEPSATVRGSVEDIGDGKTIKTELTRAKVFDGQTYSREKPDNIPVEFRAEKPSLVDEKTIEGAVEIPTLEGTELAKSEQQITEFLKRVRTTTRDDVDGVTLEGEEINQAGQKVTIRRTLAKSPQKIDPSATLSGNVQALGDGYTVKTEEELPKIFDGAVKSASKPDTIPEKFRAKAAIKRTEEVVEKTEAEDPDLSESEYSKTEQRITEFTVQKTTIEREDDFNEVKSQRLEENWGINIPFKEYISDKIPSGQNYEGEGLDAKNHIVREYEIDKLEEELFEFSVQIPTSIDLDLPRVLDDVEVYWEKFESESINELDTTGAQGAFRSIVQKDDGLLSSTLSLVPRIEVKFEDFWGKNLPATLHLFFLKKSELGNSQILNKAGAGSNWPIFKPKSFTTTVYGKTETKQLQVFVERAIELNSTPTGYGYQPSKGSREASETRLIPVSINIPPCLSNGFNIKEEEELDFDDDIELKYDTLTITTDNGGSFNLPAVDNKKPLKHKLKVNVSFNIPATTQTTIPKSGTYLIGSSAEPYKFGWFLVRATTIDASIFS